ncbi:putative Ig domain-containing protein [Leptospira sp. 201903070]|uniref:Ig domain-containing protein n=1 Tax=Leptospira ainlahdjerensis TaxID=2810033 RepID=A0ABS2UDU3_9LEPT|nr:putative Ig domain-containing protein [Leptospira ainlahdjerensis]MBM9578550.1 putative Ig domain-containing protein [Leptospira ainlahdjerensis]
MKGKVFFCKPFLSVSSIFCIFWVLSATFGCLPDQSTNDTLVLLGNPISGSRPLPTEDPILPNLSFSNSSLTFVKNVSIIAVQPTSTGNPTTFSIEPALPSGLSFDTNTGEISGIPTTAQGPTSYTITASNENGSTSVSIDITIQALNSSWASYLKSPNSENFAGSGDSFGNKVAISGDTLVVGATQEDSNQTTVTNFPGPVLSAATDDDTALNSGAVYVFRRIGTTWALEAYLKAPNAETSDMFGTSVSISGDTIVVGVNSEDSNQTNVIHSPFTGLTPAGDNDSAGNSGAAYVFRRTGNTWALEAYLKAPNAAATNQFGNAVAISGDTIVVGAVFEDCDQTSVTNAPSTFVSNTNAVDSGAAYVFSRTGTTWAFQAYLKAPNAEANDNFGSSVSISEDSNTIAVGARGERSNQTTVSNAPDPSLTPAGDNDSALSAGAVYVFRKSGGNWIWEAYLKAPNAEVNDQFGANVAISGSRIVVAATGEDSNQGSVLNALGPSLTPAGDNDAAAGAGAAYVFVRSGSTWSWESYLKAPNAENFAGGDSFGASVAIFGDIIVVGASAEDSSWSSVLNSPSVFPTSATDDDTATNSGAAYVFHRSNSGWSIRSYLKAPNAENVGGTGDGFGSSVGVSNDCIVIGASGEDSSQNLNVFAPNTPPAAATDDDAAINTGAVYTYDR